jgi:hypothetical protein
MRLRCESDGPFLRLAVFQRIFQSLYTFNIQLAASLLRLVRVELSSVWMPRKTSLLLQRRLHSNAQNYLAQSI